MFQSVFTDELAIGFMEALDTLASWGLKHVDLRGGVFGRSVEALSDEQLGEVKVALEQRGLAVGALESSLAKVHLPEKDRRAQEAEKLEGIIRAADALDCRLVRAFFYWQPKGDEAGELAVRPDLLQLALDAFMPLADRAREAGLVLAFENCGVTTDEALAVLDAIGEPRWGLAWDVSNEWFTSDEAKENPQAYLNRLAPRTRIVHVKARGSVAALGDVAPYDQVLQALDNHGLKGPVSIETHNPDRSVSNTDRTKAALDAIRAAWPTAAPGMVKDAEPERAEIVRDYEPVRFVVVGLGMGRSRAKGVQGTPGTELIGVCDIDEERAVGTGKDLGVPHTTDVREWLDKDEVEVVYVLTPSGAHAEVGVQALEAGKHVLTTKPMDVSTDACDRMIRLAEKKGLVLGVDFGMRFESGLLSMKKFVGDGRLGRILGGQVSLKVLRTMEYFRSNGGWRGTIRWDGGGAMSNQGIHHVDQVVFLLGPPDEVRCNLWTQNHEIEGEDLGCALWRYADGSVVSLYMTTCYPHSTWYFDLEIHGTEGAFSSGSGGPLEKARNRFFYDDAWTDEPPDMVVSDWLNAADNFADAVRTGAPLVCSGRDGRRTQAVLEAMYKSGREGDGQWVKVEAELS